MAATSSSIERERTAIRRTFLSRPMSLALEDGLIGEGASILDYGCGRGDDVRHLRRLGYPADGWDPVFAPDGPLTEADVVNLGYVVNVIEDPLERQAALRRAWSLARGVLVVSARLQWEASALGGTAHNDGVVTLKNTFQKFYTQEELRAWVESTLSVEAVAGAPGIFYVFRGADGRQHFLARRTRSRPSGPSVRVADLLFEQHRADLEPLIGFVKEHRRLPKPGDDIRTDHLTAAFGSVRAAFALIRRVTGADQWSDVDTGTARPLSERRFERHRELLQPLIDFVSTRGRMPRPGEIPGAAELASEFGSIRAAYGFIRRLTGAEVWKAVERRCREDLLVYLALSSFGGRPRFSDLPEDLRYDVRDFFGTYQRARTEADVLLFAAGNRSEIDRACQKAEVGKLTVEALYVHTSALNPVFRTSGVLPLGRAD